MNLIRTAALLFSASSLFLGCSLADKREPNEHLAQTRKRAAALQALLDSVVTGSSAPAIPGALLHVDSRRLGFDWSGAAGVSDVVTGQPLRPDSPVRIASNTKTFVAAALLRLVESGRLALDDPIAATLPASEARILRSDGYDLHAITLRLLLTHTSGLFSHGAADEFLAAILADPHRRWTPDDQVQGAVDWGDPLWPPGQAFSYSDTGYVLLGRVIERVTGESLPTAVRSLLRIDGTDYASTWWEILEPEPSAGDLRAHQYLDGADTFDWDASFDLYGGGGLVSSMADLALFWRRLFEGDEFDRAGTLDTMRSSPLPPEQSPYRMGLFAGEVDGLVLLSHGGYWGTQAAYIPSLDLVVTAAVTEQEQHARAFRLVEEAVRIVRAMP